MKKAFTYRTDEKMIMALKMQSLREGVNANELLDRLINSYIEGAVLSERER